MKSGIWLGQQVELGVISGTEFENMPKKQKVENKSKGA